jgi:hypothetical protein
MDVTVLVALAMACKPPMPLPRNIDDLPDDRRHVAADILECVTDIEVAKVIFDETTRT